MKNNIFIPLFIAFAALLGSCESDIEPTRDTIEYDVTKPPVIISNVDLTDTEVAVGGSVSWSVDFEAFNGIEAIFLNDKEVFAFGNGQLKFSTTLSLVMPDADSHTVKLKVTDEAGLETLYPPFDIKAGGRIPSPYLICGLASDNVIPLKDGVGNDRRVIFTTYANSDNNVYSNNMGWVDATVDTDLESKQVRIGVPGFNTAPNSPKWPSLLFDFGATAPDGTPALIFTHGGAASRMTKLAFDQVILEQLISDVAGTADIQASRVFKIDVYVEPKEVNSTFDLDYHSEIVLAMSSTEKYSNVTNNKKGQDKVMSTNITKTGEWHTLTFQNVGVNKYIPATNDLSNNEINMLLLTISPRFKVDPGFAPTCNATYYLKNLRIEAI